MNRMGLIDSKNRPGTIETVTLTVPDFAGFIALQKKQMGLPTHQNEDGTRLIEPGQIQKIRILPEREVGAIAPNYLLGSEKI